ncbi:MAG: diheme cytochrome c [Hahellaceae bacterium]|nr:diheme cytochrome c [Hahellaceae bacterium]MCP5210403.1 diheme cytochrome c [Hahellaceae bacterium]
MKIVTASVSAITLGMIITAAVFFSTDKAWSDEDGDKSAFWDISDLKRPGVAAVSNELYLKECGSCHMAYPPGLLPEKSWVKMMGELENHFGENAELGDAVRTELLVYMLNNSADKADYRRSKKIMRSLSADETVDRISLTPYFLRKHDEVPQRFVADNPKVRSFSNCDACHLNAVKGNFNEDEISIPGVGYWHD